MSVNLSYEKIEYKMRELQIACEKYKETNRLADWVLNAIHRHIYTGRATNQFLYDFLNYPTYKFEILIKKCLNGDRSIEGITKTVKKVISKRK